MSINVQSPKRKIRNALQACCVRMGKWLWRCLTAPVLVHIVVWGLIYVVVVGFNFGWFSFPDLSPKTRIKNYELDYKDLISYKLNYRDAFFKALSGLAVLIGLLIAYHRLRTANEEQMTNRFAKAVELLANDDTSVRLGALYALERIANDSPKDYAAIIETIAAYVRSRAPWPAPEPESEAETENAAQKPKPKVKEDISAAIHILGRRKKVDHPQIFLNDTDLSGLTLTAMCDFSKVNFQNARLSHVKLLEADLAVAFLWGADLAGALLIDTNLEAALLLDVNLARASLMDANLEGAHLGFANLTGANLEGAKNLTWEQLDYARENPEQYLTGAKLPDYLLENPPDWYRPLMEREAAE